MSSDIEDNWAPSSFPIPKHWKYVGIDDVFINLSLTGKRLAQKEYEVDGIYPVVDQGESLIGGYSSDSSKLISAEKSVVIFGDHTKRLKFIPFPFIPGADGIKVLCPRENVVPKYAFYACRSIRLPDRGYSRHFSFLKKSKFPLAPLDEQKHIVAKIEELFSELDNGIASLKTAREQLKVYRQAVLKHAFEGKLTAQWRKENADKLESPEQLLARIQQEREQRYQQQLEDWKKAVSVWEANGKEGKKPSKPKKLVTLNKVSNAEGVELPRLPVGWNYVRLGAFIDEPTYGTSAKCSYEGNTGVLRIPNVVNGIIDDSDLKFADFGIGEVDHLMLKDGDLLTIRSNGSISLVGTCALVRDSDIHNIFAGYLIRLRPNKNLVLPSFLLALMSSHLLRQQIEKAAKSTSGVNNINSGELQNLIIPVPTIQEQRALLEYLAVNTPSIDTTELEVSRQLHKAETLRQSILKKAFSGRLTSADFNEKVQMEVSKW